MPTPRPRITGAVSRVTVSLGPRSTIQRAPASCRRVDLGDPVDGRDEDGLGHVVGKVDVESDGLGPVVDHVDAVGQARGVEADLDLDRRRTPG